MSNGSREVKTFFSLHLIIFACHHFALEAQALLVSEGVLLHKNDEK